MTKTITIREANNGYIVEYVGWAPPVKEVETKVFITLSDTLRYVEEKLNGTR